ncbi:MAG TPA: TrmH family RNA methyltransferase [Candidatus Saccharimonadales bacterium]
MPKITLVLHNIRSTHNVGAIFRTAEGFGVEKIICSGYTPYPKVESDVRLPHISEKLTSQIHKTALGAEEMVPFEYYEDIDQWFRQNRLPVLALEQSPDSQIISEYIPPEEFVLLLGEEVHGIEEQYLRQAKATLEIPMKGKKESFNVSIATGIALYALS